MMMRGAYRPRPVCTCDVLIGASINDLNIIAMPLLLLLHKLLHGDVPHALDPYWKPDDYGDDDLPAQSVS